MIETILLWILIAAGVIVFSPVVLGLLGLLFAVLLVTAFYLGVLLFAIVTIILAAIASPFIALFEKIKSLRKK